MLNTAAPGAFRAQETGPNRFEPSEVYDGRIIGAWQETASGYSLEVRVPLNLIGEALGVGVIDVDRSGADYAVELTASWDEATGGAGRFIRQRPELQTLLSQFGRAGGRFRVLDQDGWVLAVTGRVAPGTTGDDGVGLLGGLFRWLLEREDPPYPPERPAGRIADETLRQALLGRATTAWYGSGPEREAIVAAAVPIAGAAGVEGAIVHEQASDPILTLTESRAGAPDDVHLIGNARGRPRAARLRDLAIVARAAPRRRSADRARSARRDSQRHAGRRGGGRAGRAGA